MKPLTIEIHGTGTHNRGAELMAIAIAERMRATFPGVRLVVPPSFGGFESRVRHDFWTTCEFQGRVRSKFVAAAIRMAAPGIRSTLGVIDPEEINVVLDASGFAFSDQWGPGQAKTLFAKMTASPRAGKPLLLLPQALGPFSNPEVASASRSLFNRASLVCARDQQSYAAAKELGGSFRLEQYPDFTLGVTPIDPSTIELPECFSAIVPNYRMLDKTDGAQNYLEFLKRAITILREKSLNPVFVLHDAKEDQRVIDQIVTTHPLPVLSDPDPRVLKGILGKAAFVIGSRFHALVSSFSQGIPCIGAGWSHKYPELFRDFDSADLLVEDLSDRQKLENLIAELADSDARQARSTRIDEACALLKAKCDEMWRNVEQIVASVSVG